MKLLLRTCLFILIAWLQLSGISFAKQVFLQDGSVLDCQSFWRRGQQIVVKVNRDVILEFQPSEVDLAKTFQRVKHKARVKRMNHAGDNPTPAVTPAAKSATTKLALPLPSAAPVLEPIPAAKEAVLPEPAPAASTDPASAKAELERRTRENVELMADAIRKKDPELMKKVIESQRSMQQQQKDSQKAGLKTAPLKTEPPWFKYLLMLLVSCLLILVGMWVVFKKAGQSGVKSLIPFYNGYVLMQISGKPGWWCFLLLIPVVGLAIHLLAMLSLAEKFGRSPVYGVGLVFLPMLFFPLLAFGGAQYGGHREELEFTFSQDFEGDRHQLMKISR